ncbi:FimV/HubP family polar landmark protein [Sulfuriflexus sp.]|uniref:FimV/HubP family polar landmark protein n=1 Tax=Sulfuriflexus sp. TaxID=2015443 RepID=UPI0028CC8F56|nr:FimV/HubP family polar landmark protein [Sulfuriflexus sp.]MDT8404354.1 FimV/HubP family polar landmark protein [Sulfuriflexus sp.]
MRKLKIFFVTLICLLSSNIAYTLGVGDIKVNSALNQPLDAEIKLFSLRPGEADNIRVTLGTLKDFANAGIDRPLVLSDLKFRVVDNKDGSASIRVTSTKPVKEPFLDFLVEVDWSGGRLIREYTMLLDPPVFAQRKAAPVQVPVTRAPASSTRATPAPRTMAPASASGTSAAITDNSGELFPRIELGGESATVAARASMATSDEKYKVRKNDTLWSIAASLRPDSSITTEQMMMALLRSNPQAFIDGNINGLKSGFILRVPERDMLEAINSAEAIRQTREQNELWRNARETISRGETPTGTQGEASQVEQAGAAVSADSGVKLVTPRQTDASSSAQGAGGEDNSSEQLALYNEQLASKELENADLKGRLGALQDQLESMERLLTLKEESLAELQGKLGEQAVTPAEPAPVAVEPEVKTTPAATKPTGNKSANRFALDDIVQAEIPAPKPVTAKPEARVATPVAPAANEGVFGFVKEMLNNVAVIGVLVVVVIGLLAMIWLVQRRRMAAAQFPESILTGRPATAGTESSVTEETSLLSDFAPSAMSGAIESEIGEVDPLSEADVYIAYNKHQQAEELLTSAIEQEPDRLDLKLKLMEVYYSAKNSDAFLALASEVNAAKGDQNAALWGKAAEMGRELFPDNDLFRDNSNLDAEDDFSDLQDLAELDDLETDFNTAVTEETSTLDIQEIEEPAGEFDLDMSALDEVDAESGLAGGSDEDDLSLDFDMPEAGEETDTSNGPGDFDLSAFEEDTDEVVAKDEAPVTEFDAAELDMAMSDETEEAPAEEDEILGLDEVATKLDLAKAYIDMGDPDGARSILDEVLNEGNDGQKAEAQGLINEL